MRIATRIPVLTITLVLWFSTMYLGHGTLTDSETPAVEVVDRGLFVVANSYPANITVPVVDGMVMSQLYAGHWGNWWTVNATDHQAHTLNFRVVEQYSDRVYAEYNVTISGNALVLIDLGSSGIDDFYAQVSWT